MLTLVSQNAVIMNFDVTVVNALMLDENAIEEATVEMEVTKTVVLVVSINNFNVTSTF